MLPSSHIWDTMKELNLIISGFEEENKELKDCITALQRENERLRKIARDYQMYFEAKDWDYIEALLTKEKN